MAMSAASMAEKITAAIEASFPDNQTLAPFPKAAILAICTGIIEEISTNAQASGFDSSSDSVTIPPGGIH